MWILLHSSSQPVSRCQLRLSWFYRWQNQLLGALWFDQGHKRTGCSWYPESIRLLMSLNANTMWHTPEGYLFLPKKILFKIFIENLWFTILLIIISHAHYPNTIAITSAFTSLFQGTLMFLFFEHPHQFNGVD